MNFTFDTETTGLFKKGSDYTKTSNFKNARLVSISWIISRGGSIIEQSYYIIKPDNFIISEESIKIHGITQEYAEKNGIEIKKILELFYNSIKRCTTIIAHNIIFDETIIKAELFRYNFLDIITEFDTKHKICTMIKGKEYMQLKKYPKLGELYAFLYNEEIKNAHCALDDTQNCFKCYDKLFPADPKIFYLGDKEISLTEEQQRIVFEKKDTSMLIIAGAGAGKTLSIISRIKYLLDQGIAEDSIILTTFTKNAAEDMKEKLTSMLGYKPNIMVGTIDSISKYYIANFNYGDLDVSLMEIEEYAKQFLKMLNEKPHLIKNINYLFVDEIQDINDLQFNIMNAFYNNNTFITGIGDDSQNIYEFRGSDIKFILNFEKYFKNTIKHKLTYNFRSTNEIVQVANACIENNKRKIHKTMIASQTIHGKKPCVEIFSQDEQQTEYILNKVKQLLEEGYTEDSICIMCPINQPLKELYSVMMSRNIPVCLYTGLDDSKIVKKKGFICLNTIHRSKGLEWDVVILFNMNDNLNRIPKNLEANRRLFYVGITRAKKELYIISNSLNSTRFVSEISSNLFD